MSLDAEMLMKLTNDIRAWIKIWRPRIDQWAALHQSEQSDTVRMVNYVPDLLVLTANLAKDPRLENDLRLTLLAAARYVLDGDDSLPESELGPAGLVDDALKMAEHLTAMIGHYTPHLRNNWSASGDVLDILEFVAAQKPQRSGA